MHSVRRPEPSGTERSATEQQLLRTVSSKSVLEGHHKLPRMKQHAVEGAKWLPCVREQLSKVPSGSRA